VKQGDLVKINVWLVGTGQKFPFKMGIFLRNISSKDPQYSPSFPVCEVITSEGVLRVSLERVFNL
jgi:hypothetical protein